MGLFDLLRGEKGNNDCDGNEIDGVEPDTGNKEEDVSQT